MRYTILMNKRTRIDNPAAKTLDERGYPLYRGWGDDVAQQLVELSQQSHILQYTPNDHGRRFASEQSAHDWYHAHERAVYTLGEHAIDGIIWFGESRSDIADGDYTFAIRMYEGAQGKGLARGFMQGAHQDFREQLDYDGAIWLETDIDNVAARALYAKAGYQEVRTVDERVVMEQKSAE